jgi:hypothetical protein
MQSIVFIFFFFFFFFLEFPKHFLTLRVVMWQRRKNHYL